MSSRVTTPEPEPTVPLSDLYTPTSIAAAVVSLLPGEAEQPEYLRRVYNVEVVRDHRGRLAVTLADAYAIRDQRMATEAELHAEWMANQRRVAEVNAWARARGDFWRERFMFTLRGIPYPADQSNPQQRQFAAARLAMSELVLAAEAEAGIDPEVQAQLSWPPLTAAYSYPEPGESPADRPYRPPAQED